MRVCMFLIDFNFEGLVSLLTKEKSNKKSVIRSDVWMKEGANMYVFLCVCLSVCVCVCLWVGGCLLAAIAVYVCLMSSNEVWCGVCVFEWINEEIIN